MERSALSWALLLASKGLAVFPLTPESKIPIYGTDGHNEATTDVEQIEAWAEKYPGCNWGVHPGEKFLIVDLDVKHGKDGTKAYSDLVDFEDWDVFTVKTPSGGSHLYYKTSSGFGDRIGLLENVDVRGMGGYVVGPGSIVPLLDDNKIPVLDKDGKEQLCKYTANDEAKLEDFREAPISLKNILHQQLEADKNAQVDMYEVDLPEDIERAQKFIDRTKVAVVGGNGGGNNWTYKTAAMIREFNISEPECIRIMTKHKRQSDGTTWADRCEPPWDTRFIRDDIRVTIHNAYRYSKRQKGSKGGIMGDPDRNLEELLPGLKDLVGVTPEMEARIEESIRNRFLDKLLTYDQFLGKPRSYSFIISKWLPATGYTAVLARRGTGKTTCILDMCMNIAVDNPKWNGFSVDSGWTVVYIVGEDVEGIYQRMKAWEVKNMGIVPDSNRFLVLECPVNLLSADDLKQLEEALTEKLKDVPRDKGLIFVFDTWQRMTAKSEGQNNDKDMARAGENAEKLCRKFGGPAICAFHPPKHNEETISGNSVLENMSASIVKISQQGALSQMMVTRLKGDADGSYVNFRMDVLPIEGTNFAGEQNTGVVMEAVGSGGAMGSIVGDKSIDRETAKWVADIIRNVKGIDEKAKADMSMTKLTQFIMETMTEGDSDAAKGLTRRGTELGYDMSKRYQRASRYPLYTKLQTLRMVPQGIPLDEEGREFLKPKGEGFEIYTTPLTPIERDMEVIE